MANQLHLLVRAVVVGLAVLDGGRRRILGLLRLRLLLLRQQPVQRHRRVVSAEHLRHQSDLKISSRCRKTSLLHCLRRLLLCQQPVQCDRRIVCAENLRHAVWDIFTKKQEASVQQSLNWPGEYADATSPRPAGICPP